MKRLLSTALLVALAPALVRAQAPAPSPETATAAEAASTAAPRAWPGTVAEGFAEMRNLAAKQQLESAAVVAEALLAPNAFLRWKSEFAARGGWRQRIVSATDPLLDAAGWNGLEPDVRAEIWYSKGVIASLAKDREAAEEAFWKARATSSVPALQNDAVYDLGVLALEAGEEARAKLPEVSGQPPAAVPPAPPALSIPGLPAAQPPDPLQIARAAYLEARDRFVERLKGDWRDPDTQANVELCLERLRELDEIEKKREEQKKKEEEQKKEQQKQDQQEKDQDKKDDADKKGEQPDDPGQDDPPKDPKPDEEKKPEEKKPDDPKDAKEDESQEQKKKDAQPTEAKDDTMSPAEMIQLLDRLQKIEEEGKRIQAQLKAARRVKVKKDW